MIFEPTAVDGAFVVELERHEDERGWFARTWAAEEMAAAGLATLLPQTNTSFNARRGTLRGMHFQLPPHAEAKLVRCTRGRIHDVGLDLRRESPTYLKHVAHELTPEGDMLYLPEGVAHGFVTLEDASEVAYWMSASFVAEAGDGVRWDDPAFGIDWPLTDGLVMSDRDRGWPDFAP